jgi:hypothetical protein
MKLLPLITLALVAAISSKAQPAIFAEAIVSKKLVSQMENTPTWPVR